MLQPQAIPDYAGAESFIIARLQKELPASLTYHGIHHTIDVMQAAMRIANFEKITEEEKKLMRVAIAFHDAGFLCFS